MFKLQKMLRKCYFCKRCGHHHLYDSLIGQKHRQFDSRKEKELEIGEL